MLRLSFYGNQQPIKPTGASPATSMLHSSEFVEALLDAFANEHKNISLSRTMSAFRAGQLGAYCRPIKR